VTQGVPDWFTAEVMRRLRGGKRVPGSLQHYACCPVPAHGDRHASMGIRPGDDVMIVFNCKAGCSPEEIRGALADLGIPDEFLGPYGTPGWAERNRVRATSEERRQVERMRYEMLELKATLRGLLDADLSLAMLKVRILAVVEEVVIPAGRKEYVAFAIKAGVSQPRAYAAWKVDPLAQTQDQCVTGDHVVLARPEEERQAGQVSTGGVLIEPRNPLSNRELAEAAGPGDSRNENYRNEKTEEEAAMRTLRDAGLTKPAA
jgi:hypothetical protein